MSLPITSAHLLSSREQASGGISTAVVVKKRAMQKKSAHACRYVSILLVRRQPTSAKFAAMRFKTFGDLDAPEWILAQIVTMFAIFAFVSHSFSQTQCHFCRAKLSSIRFKMLCTQVIACMPWRMHCGDRELVGDKLITVAQATVGAKTTTIAPGHYFGTGFGLKSGDARRMIGVSMGAHDPTNTTLGRFQNGFRVHVVFGARVNHEHFVISHEIGVRARASHVAGIRCSDAAHER
jgi:hypothetical protein